MQRIDEVARNRTKRFIAGQLREIVNTAVIRGEIEGHDALAIHMDIITTMIAQVRDAAERAEFVVTLVQALPQMVEVVRIGGDARVVSASGGTQ